jgi:hypothetical protein
MWRRRMVLQILSLVGDVGILALKEGTVVGGTFGFGDEEEEDCGCSLLLLALLA